MVCSGEIKYYLMQTRPNENEPRKYRFSAESTNSLYQLGYQHSIHSKRTKLFPRCPVQCINAGFDPDGTSDILFCSIVSKRCLTNN